MKPFLWHFVYFIFEILETQSFNFDCVWLRNYN